MQPGKTARENKIPEIKSTDAAELIPFIIISHVEQKDCQIYSKFKPQKIQG